MEAQKKRATLGAPKYGAFSLVRENHRVNHGYDAVLGLDVGDRNHHVVDVDLAFGNSDLTRVKRCPISAG